MIEQKSNNWNLLLYIKLSEKWIKFWILISNELKSYVSFFMSFRYIRKKIALPRYVCIYLLPRYYI